MKDDDEKRAALERAFRDYVPYPEPHVALMHLGMFGVDMDPAPLPSGNSATSSDKAH